MSRKPTIKISYPDASDVAMMLTDAMIRRAPGKRVLETTSEDKAGDGEGSLLDGLDSVRTSTGVEMTLTLDPNSMDYALQQLIRPNLTEEERKRIFHEDSAGGNDIFSPHAGEAAGASACTDAVDSACRAADEAQTQSGEQEEKIEIGKISDTELRIILTDLVDAAQGYVQGGQDAWKKHIENAIETAIKEIDHRAGVIDLDETYEQEAKIEIGKIPDAKLREILRDFIKNLNWSAIPEDVIREEIEETILDINHAAGVIDLDETYRTKKQVDRDLTKQIAAALNVASLKIVTTEELKHLENFASSLNAILIDNDEEMQDTYIRIGDLRKELIHARYFGGADANKRYIELQEEINPNTGLPWSEYEAYELRENKMEPPPHKKIAAAAQEREKPKKAKKSRKKKQDPSWDDVEAEARQMQAPAPKQSAAPLADEDKTDDIEPGLLNDLDDGSDGMAPAEEVMGHDE